jgi:hypothetical protein
MIMSFAITRRINNSSKINAKLLFDTPKDPPLI